MPNPARILADLLAEWKTVPLRQTSEAIRQDPDWAKHRIAVRQLIEIERFLAGMAAVGQPVEEFSAALPAWIEAVVSYRVPWSSAQTNGVRQSISDGDLRLLRALATVMDTANFTEPVPPDNLSRLLEATGRAETLIRDSTDVDLTAKRYLLALIVEARTVLNDLDTYGEAAARHVAFELGGALLTVSGSLPEETAKTWRERALDILQELTVFAGKATLGFAALKLGLPPGQG